MILAPNLWFGEKSDRQPRSTSGGCSSPPTLSTWSVPPTWVCTCAVLHPRINHLFDPLIKLPWFPLQELLLWRKGSLYEQFRNKLKSNTGFLHFSVVLFAENTIKYCWLHIKYCNIWVSISAVILACAFQALPPIKRYVSQNRVNQKKHVSLVVPPLSLDSKHSLELIYKSMYFH